MTAIDDLLRQNENSPYAYPAAPTPAPTPAPDLSLAQAPLPKPTDSLSGVASLSGVGDHPDCGPYQTWDDAAQKCVPLGNEDECDPNSQPQCGNYSATCVNGHWECSGDVDDPPNDDPTGPLNNCGTANCIPPMVCVQRAWGPNCENPNASSGSGGGGGGSYQAPPVPTGGRSSGSAPAFAYSRQATDFNALLDKMVREALTNPSRFTPEALQALYGAITRQRSNTIASGERAVRANAAQRGMSRSGAVDAALRGVQAGAESQKGQAIVGVQMAKINADYQDKMGALDRAQKYLDSLRDSEYRLMVASEQRSQFDSNLALAYASLAEQRTRLQMQLQSDWDKLNALAGYGLLTSGV